MQIAIVNGKAFKYTASDTLEPLSDGVYEVKANKQDFRTAQQNRAMHLYFRLLADALNDAGLDIKETIKADISWGEKTVKEIIWKGIQWALLRKNSTTSLSRDEVNKVYEVVHREMAKRYGIDVKFPDIDELLFDRKIKETKR